VPHLLRVVASVCFGREDGRTTGVTSLRNQQQLRCNTKRLASDRRTTRLHTNSVATKQQAMAVACELPSLIDVAHLREVAATWVTRGGATIINQCHVSTLIPRAE
jgi:hypothetical protein